MLQVQAVTTREELLALKPLWGELLSQSDIDCPFMTFEWFNHWLGVLNNEHEMLVLVVRDGGELIAIAPLKRSTMRLRRVPITCISFLSSGYMPRAGIITNGKNPECWSAIRSYLERHYTYDVLLLDLLVKDSFTDQQIRRDAQQRGLFFREECCKKSPYIPMSTSWEQYLAERNRKTRKHMEHADASIRKAGHYEVVEYHGEQVETAIEHVMDIARHTWKCEQHGGMAGTEERVAHYSALMRMLAAQGWLTVHVSYLDKVPVAFIFGIDYHGKRYAKQTGYRQDYQKLAPGYVLVTNVIKLSFEQGIREFDFLGKDERFKLELSPCCREHTTYTFFNSTWRGTILRSAEHVVPQLKGLKQRLSSLEIPARLKEGRVFPLLCRAYGKWNEMRGLSSPAVEKNPAPPHD